MAQATHESRKSKAAGRKDKDGTEKTITLQPLRVKLKHLAALNDSLDAARSQYNAAVKAIAEQTGLMSTVINKLVKARAKDTVFDEARKAEQLSMLFAELGDDNAEPQQAALDSMDSGAAKPAKRNGKTKNGAGDEQPPIGEGAPPDADPLNGTPLAAGAPEGQTFGRYLADKEAAAASGVAPTAH